MTIVGNTGATEHRCLVAGEDLVLACELSRPDAAVRWLRDGREVQLGERVQVVSRGALRELTVRAAQPGDSGCYVCDAASDRMVTSVEVAGERAGVPRSPGAPEVNPVPERGGDSSVTCCWWQRTGEQHQGTGGALSPRPAGAVGEEGACQGRQTHTSWLPRQGLVKFILGRLPGASPPALAAKG